MHDVSIIIVNYFLSKSVCKSIDILLEYTKANFEIIIIDNSANAKEKNILSKLKKDHRIKVIFNKKNKGFAFACNQGVALSSGRYIFFLNPDAYIVKDAIETLLHWIDILKADAVGPKIFLDEDLSIPQPPFLPHTFWHVICHNLFPKLYSNYWRKYSYNFWNISKPQKINFLSGAAFLIKRELAKFDERFFLYFEDLDLFYRLKKLNKKVFFCPYSKVVHMFDLSPSENKVYLFNKSKVLFFKKHYPKLIKILKFSEKHRKIYIDKRATAFKEYFLKNNSTVLEMSFEPDFVPFVKTDLNFKKLPSFIKRYKDRLWVRKIN